MAEKVTIPKQEVVSVIRNNLYGVMIPATDGNIGRMNLVFKLLDAVEEMLRQENANVQQNDSNQ